MKLSELQRILDHLKEVNGDLEIDYMRVERTSITFGTHTIASDCSFSVGLVKPKTKKRKAL